MKIDRSTLNKIITFVIVITTLSVVFSFRRFIVGTIDRDVASIHAISLDGTIDYYTEDPKQCKFLELYFDTFVDSQEGALYSDDEKIYLSEYPFKIEVSTNSGFEYVVLFDKSQYDAVNENVEDLQTGGRSKNIPTMKYLKTEDGINYFTVNEVSDKVLNVFFSSLRYKA